MKGAVVLCTYRPLSADNPDWSGGWALVRSWTKLDRGRPRWWVNDLQLVSSGYHDSHRLKRSRSRSRATRTGPLVVQKAQSQLPRKYHKGKFVAETRQMYNNRDKANLVEGNRRLIRVNKTLCHTIIGRLLNAQCFLQGEGGSHQRQKDKNSRMIKVI